MWIKVHDHTLNKEIIVQTLYICAIEPFVGAEKGCCIAFVGSENNYIRVKETVDEIGAMITE